MPLSDWLETNQLCAAVPVYGADPGACKRQVCRMAGPGLAAGMTTGDLTIAPNAPVWWATLRRFRGFQEGAGLVAPNRGLSRCTGTGDFSGHSLQPFRLWWWKRIPVAADPDRGITTKGHSFGAADGRYYLLSGKCGQIHGEVRCCDVVDVHILPSGTGRSLRISRRSDDTRARHCLSHIPLSNNS